MPAVRTMTHAVFMGTHGNPPGLTQAGHAGVDLHYRIGLPIQVRLDLVEGEQAFAPRYRQLQSGVQARVAVNILTVDRLLEPCKAHPVHGLADGERFRFLQTAIAVHHELHSMPSSGVDLANELDEALRRDA